MQNDLISRSALLHSIDKNIAHMRNKAGEDKLLNSAINLVQNTRDFIAQVPAVDAVVIPCKIGDTVWAIRRLSGGNLRAMQGVVSEMQFIGSEMRLSITLRNRCRGEWGKTIFATQEDAEKEVNRRTGHGHERGC